MFIEYVIKEDKNFFVEKLIRLYKGFWSTDPPIFLKELQIHKENKKNKTKAITKISSDFFLGNKTVFII